MINQLLEKIVTPLDFALACFGAIFGIIFGVFLSIYGWLPPSLSLSHMAVLGVLLFLGLKHLIAVIPTREGHRTGSLNRRTTALLNVIEDTPAGRNVPGRYLDQLDVSHSLWINEQISSRDYDQVLTDTERRVKRSLHPILEGRKLDRGQLNDYTKSEEEEELEKSEKKRRQKILQKPNE